MRPPISAVHGTLTGLTVTMEINWRTIDFLTGLGLFKTTFLRASIQVSGFLSAVWSAPCIGFCAKCVTHHGLLVKYSPARQKHQHKLLNTRAWKESKLSRKCSLKKPCMAGFLWISPNHRWSLGYTQTLERFIHGDEEHSDVYTNLHHGWKNCLRNFRSAH